MITNHLSIGYKDIRYNLQATALHDSWFIYFIPETSYLLPSCFHTRYNLQLTSIFIQKHISLAYRMIKSKIKNVEGIK